MKVDQIVQEIAAQVGEGLIESHSPKPSRVQVTIRREALPDVAQLLFGKLGARYVVGGGTDLRDEDGCFLITHFFALDRDGVYVTVHCRVPGDDAVVPSITPLVPAAAWAEREIYDTVGVRPQGHPDPRRLVLADDWPDDLFPLRQDFALDARPPSDTSARPVLQKAPDGAHVVPIGPF
ncbi:MAG TPA: NADH-quinone oxidoreductase subunit C, partial [Armatimonadota bacterium]|nr:NADH-quinone oxidoreductase subunit C [Armatimonadota bacterium]